MSLALRGQFYDKSSLEGRSQERYRRIVLSVLSLAAARGTTVVGMLVMVPAALAYLGPERCGLWMTITSFLGMLSCADLGIGYGLLNAISESHGKDDRRAARKHVSNAAFLLTAIGIGVIVLFALLYPVVPWLRILNVAESDAAGIGPALAVLGLCLALNLPLGIVQRVQLGYQEGFVNSFWEAAGSLLALGALLLAILLGASLPWLVAATLGAPLLAWLLNSILHWSFTRPWLRPAWADINAKDCRRLASLGLFFLVLQLSVSFAYWSDSLIAAQVLGPSSVAQYSVAARLFAIPSMLVSIALTPFWPAYREAMARGELAWVSRALKRSLAASFLLGGALALLLALSAPQLIRWWVGPEFIPSAGLIVGLTLWSVISACGNAIGTFLNGAGALRFQLIAAPLMACAKVVISIVMARHFGLAGIVWGTIAAYVVFVLLPCVVVIPRILEGFACGAKHSPA